VILENGEQHDGDILIGADGIWSEVNYTTLLFQFCFQASSLFFLLFPFNLLCFVFSGSFETLWAPRSKLLRFHML